MLTLRRSAAIGTAPLVRRRVPKQIVERAALQSHASHNRSGIGGIGAPQARSESRTTVCQFRAAMSCAQLKNLAPIRLAPDRSAPSMTALKKLVSDRSA